MFEGKPDTGFLRDQRIDLLQESRFWIRIFKEHSLFIRLGLPCDRLDLISEAQGFFEELSALEDVLMARRNLDSRLVQEIRIAVTDLVEFKERILRMLIQCEIHANMFPLLIDHIRREAVRFLRLLETGRLTSPGRHLLTQLMGTEVFWLRIMKEHIEFIQHLLDPSERVLLRTLEAMRIRFSGALDTARDLRSMSESNPDYFNTVIRFTDEVMELVRQLRDVKAQAYELLLQCRMLSAIPSPLLADHVRREADKFLEDLKVVRQELQRFETPARRPQ
ncbi:MAG TPA: DUF2935 domain-containing protein [Firmicutes bacterium]|nr:DUF2935 domain-containing protein [Candidatus Fermentithermobacillaceae bacterium]